MFRKLTSLFIFFCCLYRYSLCDCFYIFDVGEGNCQLAVFEDEKIGIMYDCGSSSTRESIKIFALKQNDYHYISKKLQVTNISKVNPTNEDKSPLIKESKRMSRNFIHGNRKIFHIQEVIAFHQLRYLFIILSHPDKDHINLINDETIPEGLSIMVLCGGDWLNHKSKGKVSPTKDVCNVLKFLKKRKNTRVKFLFYRDEGEERFYTLYDIVFGEERVFENIIPSNELKDDRLNILRNIRITHFPLKEINAQSVIVGIKMEKLKTQFFLTGDASKKTFKEIIESNKNFFKKEEGYVSFVMLPHHGAKSNTSDNLFELFDPDIVGVSAGDGIYHHPEKELMDKIIKRGNNGKVHLNNGSKMITYKKGEKEGFLFENDSEKMPFVCTNQLGDIKIDEVGIKAKFSNIVKDGESSYEVDYGKHKAGIICTQDEIRKIKKDSKKIFCFCVKENLCYSAKKIDTESKAADPIE